MNSACISRILEKGFTSIEFLSTVILLIVSATVVAGVSSNVQNDYKIKQTRELEKKIANILVQYYKENCSWPVTGQTDSLSSAELLLILKKNKATKKLLATIPKSFFEIDSKNGVYIIDAFGNRLIYKYAPENKKIVPLLISSGRDLESKNDDILLKIQLDSKLLMRQE